MADEPSLRQQLLKLLASPKYQPLDKTDLAHALEVPADQRTALRNLLRELETEGAITRLRKNRFVLPKQADLVSGTIQINPRGFGFITDAESPDAPQLFVAADNTGTAMNGDTVVARLERDIRGNKAEPTVEGHVIRILKRANDTIVGTLQRTKNFLHVVPDDPRLVHDIYVPQSRKAGPLKAELGDKVVVVLEEWTSRHVNPEGKIIEVLGPATAPGVDMLSVIRKYHLATEFPPNVLDEAANFPAEVLPKDISGREDLRSARIFTIDPDDARDFDDAIHVARQGAGWRLGVHIADVSHYVHPGSALDREARQRGNSVYLPDRVLPMLPERLSNGLCSLRPDEDRLTFTVWMTFDAKGKMKRATFSRSVIRSIKRLTYQEAFAVLNNRAHSPVEDDLHTAWALASILRKNRFRHGSLDLDFPEIKVRVDHHGRAIALEKVEHDISHQLIEEFMLAANEAVAAEVKKCATPAVYRIHEKPDPEKLAEFRDTLTLAGYRVGDLTQRAEVQKFLNHIRGKPDEPAMKTAFLRSLKRATYDTRALGHYGLAKANYTHFTSPIRRYADLVVHRVLGAIIASPGASKTPQIRDLAATAGHISTAERNAADAEREAVKLKKLEFFSRQLEMKKPDRFDGFISDIKNFGLVVELPAFSLTGMVHISDLDDDFYLFDPTRRKFTGRRTKRSWEIGMNLKLVVTRVDRFKQQIDFRVA